MAHGIPPTADHALETWNANIVPRLVATPSAFGILALDATNYQALALDFSTRLATAENLTTRNKGTTAAKNTSKNTCIARARQIVKTISAYAPLTAQQRADLGLNPVDLTPTAVPAPVTRPMVTLDPAGNLRLVDEAEPTRRGKPAGVNGAVILIKLTATADTPPAGVEDTHLSMLLTRNKATLNLPAGSTGKTLWVLARWYNERGELGPVSTLASTLIAA